jgi:hypothetical protein
MPTWFSGLLLGASALLMVVAVAWVAFWSYQRIRLLQDRRKLEADVVKRRMAQVGNDPGAMTAAIADLRLMRALPAVPPPAAGDAGSVMRQLATFPEGAEIAQLGYRIFKWLLALAVLMTIGLVCYGWMSFPDDADVAAAVGGAADDAARADAYSQLHADWLQQVKDLGQLFLLTPVFPLIAAVIGYIFGVRRSGVDQGKGSGESGN